MYQLVYDGDLVALGINKAGTHYLQVVVITPTHEAELRHVGPDIVKAHHKQPNDDYFVIGQTGRRYLAGNGSHVCDIGLTITTEGTSLTKAAERFIYFQEPDNPTREFRPRIIGICSRTSSEAPAFEFMSICKSPLGHICDRLHYAYGDMLPGYGRCLRSKSSSLFENILLDYRGEPFLIEFPDDDEIIDQYRSIGGSDALVLLRKISISEGTTEIIGALDEKAESVLA